MDENFSAVCEGHVPQHYDIVLSKPLRHEKHIGRLRERPFSASPWRGFQTLSAPARIGGIRKK